MLTLGYFPIVSQGGSSGSGPVVPPQYDGQTFSSYVYDSVPDPAYVYFTIEPDGTWSAVNNVGTIQSGNWYLPTTGSIGSEYLVQFTPSVSSLRGLVISNPAASLSPIGSGMQLQMTQHSAGGTSESYFPVQVIIRTVGGVIVSSGTFNVDLLADLEL